MLRSYSNLSDHDFERLVADLFGQDEGRRYETFARGPDRGVDARWVAGDGARHVLQCKHMAGSTFAQLSASAKKEKGKLDSLEGADRPATYRFVTSQSLTAANKRTLAAALTPYIVAESDVWGADDLETLLDRHPVVERAHIKLWLTGRAQLDRAVNAAIWTRSAALLEQVRQTIPLYVQSAQWARAHDMLTEHRVVVLSGPPGIGKTTLADMLIADAVARGYEPVRVSADINDAEQVEDASVKQIFYYDDFLGSAFLDMGLQKNEDQRLERFMERCATSINKLFVLTTREHLLQTALDMYESFSSGAIPLRKVTLQMKDYSRVQRAEIVYNHLRASKSVPPAVRKRLVDRDAHLLLVDHQRFRPRIISYLAGAVFNNRVPDAAAWLDEAVAALDDPTRVWAHAFAHQLGVPEKTAIVALASMPERSNLKVAERAYAGLYDVRPDARPLGSGLQDVLRITEGTFTKTLRRSLEQLEVSLFDPSVQDFVINWLKAHPLDLQHAIQGAAFIEQLLWLHAAVVRDAPVGIEVIQILAERMRDRDSMGASVSSARTVEHRLASIEAAAASDTRLLAEMGSWLNRRFSLRVADWHRGPNSIEDAVGLVRRVGRRGVAVDAAVAVLRDRVTARVDQPTVDRTDWDDLATVVAAFDPAGEKALEPWRDAFLAWAQTCIEVEGADLRDLDDLNALVATGDSFGGGVEDLTFFEDVRERFAMTAWEPDQDDFRSGAINTAYNPGQEARRIEALFARFEDG